MALNLQFCIIKPRSRIILKKETKKRLNNAIKVYNQVELLLSIIKVVKLYIILKAILYCRINGSCN